jgi:carbonic anhydrase/acetyltransferase-like protein (isoleucine patch superfamily)
MLSPGVQVFPHAYIGSEARVGFGTIVNTGAIVSHDCVIGDYANISPGAILAGASGGSGAGWDGRHNQPGVRLAGARIGNGATVKPAFPTGGRAPGRLA